LIRNEINQYNIFETPNANTLQFYLLTQVQIYLV
jgi:hypothetical protein